MKHARFTHLPLLPSRSLIYSSIRKKVRRCFRDGNVRLALYLIYIALLHT